MTFSLSDLGIRALGGPLVVKGLKQIISTSICMREIFQPVGGEQALESTEEIAFTFTRFEFENVSNELSLAKKRLAKTSHRFVGRLFVDQFMFFSVSLLPVF